MPVETTKRKARHYKEPQIWQKAMLLAKKVYELTAHFPSEEKFGLVMQMRRAAVSVASNIAEGQARQSTREFLLFLSHAGGSLAELETQLLLSVDLRHCSRGGSSPAAELIGELQKMLVGMRRSLLASYSPLATSSLVP
jgi:four helix bundle protein